MKELLKNFLAKLVSNVPKNILTDRKFFELYQSKGWHITPVHFYQPVPNTEELSERIWEEPSELVGINLNIPAQLELLESFKNFIDEFYEILNTSSTSPCQYTRNSRFPLIDSHILYSMIRKYQPKRIIEIGSGNSTLLSITALRKNTEKEPDKCGQITAIEPYPKEYLEKCLVGVGKLIQERVENVPLSEFEQLEENDILFIDSSHVVKIGSDVIYEILEILPRLKKGVIIHIHDIFLPLAYPKKWVKKRYIFWNEQYLVQAFLAFNNCFEIIWSASGMNLYESEKLRLYFPDCFEEDPDFNPGSLWIRKCQ